jgi:hypothetical protein
MALQSIFNCITSKFSSPGDAVAESVSKGLFDIGISGMYVTSERNFGMEMTVAHSTDCAAFITMASKALPRFVGICLLSRNLFE